MPTQAAAPGGPVPQTVWQPARETLIAPWVRGGALARPALSLWGLISLGGLLVFTPELRALVRDYPESADNIDFGGLAEWAQGNQWVTPLTGVLTGVLLIALGSLRYAGRRLRASTERGIRLWVAAGAAYWLLWAGAIGLSTVWFLGMDDGLSGDAARASAAPAHLAAHVGVGLALSVNAVVVPFVGIGALVRLTRALGGEVSLPAPTGWEYVDDDRLAARMGRMPPPPGMPHSLSRSSRCEPATSQPPRSVTKSTTACCGLVP
ncbi:hypothetical protein [Streptomyces litchfieldiae]|uniref:Uncharacterized protein n=1 Tax=Streptomyces litchfieldiae TaxID=3075543 RepID=A0ABU2MU40_9ACTN|nr:hypothetical protein [Streptomyces sp. DSM 44938]MDT0344833.1 hypothetical protein [Streptomyces sp. DSM 44938]